MSTQKSVRRLIVSCDIKGNAYAIKLKGVGKLVYIPKNAFIPLKLLAKDTIHDVDNLHPLVPGMTIQYESPLDFSISVQDNHSGVCATLISKYVDAYSGYLSLYERLCECHELRNKIVKDLGPEHDMTANVSDLNRMVAGISDYSSFRNDPYSCLDDDGRVPFKVVDMFAEHYDVSPDIRAARHIENMLKNLAKTDGHVCAPLKYIVKKINTDTADASVDDIEDIIKRSPLFRMVGNFVYTKKMYRCEKGTATAVQALVDEGLKGGDLLKRGVVEGLVDDYQQCKGIDLNGKQRQVIKLLFSTSHIVILTGYPGTGKSSVVDCVRHVCEGNGIKYIIMAPTGKAANRLGSDAMTVHRALEVQVTKKGGFLFTRKRSNPLDYDIVIIDEASMLDSKMAYHLLDAINPQRTRLLIIGDPDQLPSVDAGDVLNKLIKSRVIPCVHLSKIYRQDPNAQHIGAFAKRVIKGKPITEEHTREFSTIEWFCDIDSNKEIRAKVVEMYDHFNGDVQVLIPSKKGNVGTWTVNEELHKHVYPTCTDRYMRGEKIICVSNCYAHDAQGEVDMMASVFNGETGAYVKKTYVGSLTKHVLAVDNKAVTVDGDSFEYGYAITVHKSQGSEYKNVVLVVDGSHGYCLNRQLLYTAIMRAKQRLVVIGDLHHINTCVQNNTPPRWSLLDTMISEAYDIE